MQCLVKIIAMILPIPCRDVLCTFFKLLPCVALRISRSTCTNLCLGVDEDFVLPLVDCGTDGVVVGIIEVGDFVVICRVSPWHYRAFAAVSLLIAHYIVKLAVNVVQVKDCAAGL